MFFPHLGQTLARALISFLQAGQGTSSDMAVTGLVIGSGLRLCSNPTRQCTARIGAELARSNVVRASGFQAENESDGQKIDTVRAN